MVSEGGPGFHSWLEDRSSTNVPYHSTTSTSNSKVRCDVTVLPALPHTGDNQVCIHHPKLWSKQQTAQQQPKGEKRGGKEAACLLGPTPDFQPLAQLTYTTLSTRRSISCSNQQSCRVSRRETIPHKPTFTQHVAHPPTYLARLIRRGKKATEDSTQLYAGRKAKEEKWSELRQQEG